jgi:hypothetical protein
MKNVFIAAAFAAASAAAHAQGLTLWTNGASEPQAQQQPQGEGHRMPFDGLLHRDQPQAQQPQQAAVCCPLTIAGYDCPNGEPHCK